MTDESRVSGMSSEVQNEDQKSFWWRIQGIFFEPTRTFQEIKRKPNWLIPTVILVLLSFGAQYYVINTVGFENIMRQNMMQNAQVRELPQEQREQIIEQQLESPVVKALTYVGPVLLVIIMLILAVIFLLAMMAVGSESDFKQIFSVICHSFLAYSVISTLLLVLVVFIAADKQAIDTTNPIQSNLGMLFDRQESPALASLASSIDILSFYLMWLFALGLSVVGRRPFGSTATIVIVLWAIYVGGKAGLAALFG